MAAVVWVVSFIHFQVPGPAGGDIGGTVLRVLVVVAVPIVLVLVAVYAFWRFRLERLAYTPGPILVVPFTDAASEGSGESPRARRLRAMFEERLAGSRVYRSTAVPTPALSNGFLQIVEHAGESLPVGWGFLTRILRALAPQYAYVVRCDLVERSDDLPGGDRGHAKGLLVELSRLPRSSVAPVTVWEEDWSRAIERAANRVAELILPRTPQCRTPPWTPWRGLRIPEELFDTYRRFQSLKGERRFDEAMVVLRRSLVMDPNNLALRLELGKLQEQMRMHLDALLTYDDLIGLASRKNRELSAWWNRPARAGDDGIVEAWSDPLRAQTLRVHHPVVEVARYRHALLLGLGYELADEWWQRPETCRTGIHLSARENRRRYLRRVLSERLTARYPKEIEPYANRLIGPDGVRQCFAGDITEEIQHEIGRQATHRAGPTTEYEARNLLASRARMVFTMASVVEVQRLISEMRTPWRTARREVLSSRALKLMVPWAVLRHVMAISAVEVSQRWLLPPKEAPESTAGSPADRETEQRDRVTRNLWSIGWRFGSDSRYLVRRGWPPKMNDDDRRYVGRGVSPTVRQILDRSPGFGSLRSWHEHYNAACVYALVLAVDIPDEPINLFLHAGAAGPHGLDTQKKAAEEDRAQASRAAVTELKKAVAVAGGARLANQRDWILTNDPDFDQLRGRDEFRDFEVLTFGSVSRAARRGPRLVRWEQVTSVSQGILDAAGRMTALWAARCSDDVGIHGQAVVLGWIENEEQAWAFLEGVAVDHRDWSRRNRFREEVRAYSGWKDFQMAPAQVVYSDTQLAVQYAAMSGRTNDQIATEQRDQGAIEGRVNYAIRQHNKRWAALAAALRADSDGRCCPRHDRIVLADEHAALRAIVGERWPGEQVRSVVAQWSRQSLRRWEALAAWFDDEAAGQVLVTERGREFRRRLRGFSVRPDGNDGRLFALPGPPEPSVVDERWQDDRADVSAAETADPESRGSSEVRGRG